MQTRSVYSKIIIGRLAEDPSLKTLKNGDSYALFTLFNTTLDENKNEVLNTQKIVSFGKQKDLIMKHIHKGDLCCVEGRIAGQITERTPIVCEKLTFLTNKKIVDKADF